MKAKTLIIPLALACLALAGCGRLGELERPGPGGPEPRTATTGTVMDPTIDRRSPTDAPIPGSNPH